MFDKILRVGMGERLLNGEIRTMSSSAVYVGDCLRVRGDLIKIINIENVTYTYRIPFWTRLRLFYRDNYLCTWREVRVYLYANDILRHIGDEG